jgi:hypothetical protein
VSMRSIVLSVGGAIVLLAAIGAIYLEILVQSRSTHDAWMVTQDVTAGTPIGPQNVRQVSVPDTGDAIATYRGNPFADHRRAGHALAPGHLLAADDLLGTEMVLVPVTFKAAPPLSHGDVVDVYTQLAGKTIQVGRALVVDTSTTIWVPAIDEPSWITLQANNAPLLAATSSGVGVPTGPGMGMQDAVATLSGTISGRAAAAPTQPTTPGAPVKP